MRREGTAKNSTVRRALTGLACALCVAALAGCASSGDAAKALNPDPPSKMYADAEMIAASSVVYLEGYLWDPKDAKDAFLKAAKIAHEAERKVALTMSDAFCVDRWRDEFLQLMRSRTVDLIFANEAELHSFIRPRISTRRSRRCAPTSMSLW